MNQPTQASSLQDPTSYSTHLVLSETATTDAAKTHESNHSDDYATAPSTASLNQVHRSIVWQIPNVAVSDVPTTFLTVAKPQPSTNPYTSTKDSLPHIASGFQTLATTATAVSMAPTTATPTRQPLAQSSQDILPDWPPILTIFLLSWLVMTWVVTVVLYLATFPEKVAWLDRLIHRRTRGRDAGKRKTRNGYKVDAERNDFSTDDFGYYNTSKVTQDTSEGTATSVAIGLGISFAEFPQTPRLRRPCSFDPESLETAMRGRGISSMSTALLPSSRSFTALSPTMSSKDRQPGTKHRRADVDNHVFSGHDIWAEPNRDKQGGGIASTLESVNAVIGFVAGRLVKMTSDRVNGRAEDGLLLPVRDDERELPRVPVGDC